ncbi:MAG: DNA-binding transcriptional MerR regulator [Oceanicoccus sp.]|jgi:DNA-binding transcriptional MerR regulator
MGSYNISQMVDETGLTAHTLRYYERELLIQNVPRDQSGRRSYSLNHVKGVKFINALRSTGMPIKDIKRYLTLYNSGEETRADRLSLLKSHRISVSEKLQQITTNLEVVDRKIKGYESGLY